MQAAILQQAAEYISFLIAERQQLLELNRQYIAATRCLPAKRRRGSDGELSDDGTVYTEQLSCKRRSPTSCDSTHSRSQPIKKRKDEVTSYRFISRAHSFPRQILPNSAPPFAKFRGSLRQILEIPRLTAAAHFRVHCADFGPVMPQNFSIIVTSNY